MKVKALYWAIGLIAAAAIAAGYRGTVGLGPIQAAEAQDSSPVHFAGLISDYTPATFVVAGVPKTVGPWEIRGEWSIDLRGQSGTGNFSAALNMQLSDYAITEGIAAVDTVGARHPHTHHIIMNGATVTSNPANCPANAVGTPAYTAQFELNGMADAAGNGGSPFGAGVLVPLQVCVYGGTDVPFSNVTLVFPVVSGESAAAAGHFGSQPIRGVVTGTN